MAETNETMITIFGLVGAGKTSYVSAVSRTLNLYAEEYERSKERLGEFQTQLNDMQDSEQRENLAAKVTDLENRIKIIQFTYSLADPEGREVEAVLPVNIPPSTVGYGEQTILIFQRKARENVLVPARQISSHYHRITLRDFPGEVFLTEDGSSSVFREQDHQIARNALRQSNYIMIILDHRGDPKKEIKAVKEMVKRYRTGRKFAVCMSKIDLWPDARARFSSPWRVIEDHYGRDFKNTLSTLPLVGKVSGNDETGAFLISATGYLEDGTPNFYEEGDNIGMRDDEKWSPFRVEYPFFAILEDVERRRLKKAGGISAKLVSRENHYIGYPLSV